MSEKKKSFLNGLFKSSGGCSCGVKIVEEPNQNEESKDTEKSKSKKASK